MKLILTGSIAYDYLMAFPGKFSEHLLPEKLDKISVSFLVEDMRKQQGGCAANIAYSLALLGESPLLFGAAGVDFNDYKKSLDKAGVDTSGVTIFPEAFTSSFFANTDQEGNQICSFYSGAMSLVKNLSLKQILEPNADALVLISPNDPVAMVKFAKECQELDVPFIWDPSQQIIRLSADELRQGAQGAKMIIVNEYELEMFLKKTALSESDLLNLAEILIVTLGEKGAVIKTGDGEIAIPVVTPGQISDPTGVGDAFRSGLLKGMMAHCSWEVAGRMGSLAATYVLETEGAQCHCYSLSEFTERYQQVFGPEAEMERVCR